MTKKPPLEKAIERLPGAIKATEVLARLTDKRTPSGARKRALVIAEAAYGLAITPKEKRAVGLVNDAIVAAFNLAGLFSKAAKK